MNTGSKSETLEHLEGVLRSARVLPQIRFSLAEWKRQREAVWKKILSAGWDTVALIVRSSALDEDQEGRAQAGRFLSVPNVAGRPAIEKAIFQVAASFEDQNPSHQIFLQPYLKDVILSGVAFSRDPNTGGPYFVINFDEKSGSSSSVTSGRSSFHKTIFVHREAPIEIQPKKMLQVLSLLREVEDLLGLEAVDVEFAVGRDAKLYLLQARPLAIPAMKVSATEHKQVLKSIRKKIAESIKPHPYLFGKRTVYGVMPDWNPAEIIGIRPRPLALAMYKELITDNIWAYQRDNYGYRNLRSFPLLVDFSGLPYIDVRVSFNSFIPADLETPLAKRLADYYIRRLIENPQQHDKVEFDIIYSCYTLDLPARLESLKKEGFSKIDLKKLSESLRVLTNRIVHEKEGLWKHDIEKIHELTHRRHTIFSSSLEPVSKIYWLLEDCKRYGTLPFAGLARAAFIAVQLLKSLESTGILSCDHCVTFMASLNTVSSALKRDFTKLNKEEFLKRYGHLRPGSYDILSPRYDEAPEKYFDWSTKKRPSLTKTKPFRLSRKQSGQIQSLLAEHGFDHSAESFFRFIREAIEGREYAKFIFSRSLSDSLSLFKNFSQAQGFSLEDTSYADIECIKTLYSSSAEPRSLLEASIRQGKRRYAATLSLSLPPLIVKPDEVWSFEQPPSEPNFVTLGNASGAVSLEKNGNKRLKDSILFLPSADPGYDWIFSHGIAGFVTKYGGVNSHMAIRAGEMKIPAVIGAGETLYTDWSKARKIRIDCEARQVTALS